MAKIYGLFGAMKGKVADVVMAVRNGEQVVRKYQPSVYNPSTPAQVAARAKLKLMSQLSAVMAPVIAIKGGGGVSSRNRFVKKNYPMVTFDDNHADIVLSGVQLTDSVVSFPAVSGGRSQDYIVMGLTDVSAESPIDVDRVVYAMFEKEDDNTLRYVTSRVVTNAGTDKTYPVQDFPLSQKACVFYAYGVRDNTDAAKVKFGNMETLSAETVAKLIVSSILTLSDVTLTETTAFALPKADSKQFGKVRR